MNLLIFFFFFHLSTSIEINCKFNFQWNWQILGVIYSCDVQSINFSDDRKIITKVTGTHESSKSNFDVKGIIFHSENCPKFNLKVIPKRFLKFFPNFVGFHFKNCSINFLDGHELDEYKELEHFELSNSNLEEIPGNFFDKNPNLKIVIFNNNKIKKIGEGLLDFLGDLKKASFKNNICIDSEATTRPEIFELIEYQIKKCVKSDAEEPQECQIENVENLACKLGENFENSAEKEKKMRKELEKMKNEAEKLEEIIKNVKEENEKLVEEFKKHAESFKEKIANGGCGGSCGIVRRFN